MAVRTYNRFIMQVRVALLRWQPPPYFGVVFWQYTLTYSQRLSVNFFRLSILPLFVQHVTFHGIIMHIRPIRQRRIDYFVEWVTHALLKPTLHYAPSRVRDVASSGASGPSRDTARCKISLLSSRAVAW